MKKTLPLARVYQLLEPGPVVLVTTAHAGTSNVMTMTWQTMIDFEPPIFAFVMSDQNSGSSEGLDPAFQEAAAHFPSLRQWHFRGRWESDQTSVEKALERASMPLDNWRRVGLNR